MTESRTRPEGLAGSRVDGEGTGAGRGGRQLTARVASGPGDGHLPLAILTRRRPGELSALVSIVPLPCGGSQPDPCPGEGD